MRSYDFLTYLYGTLTGMLLVASIILAIKGMYSANAKDS